MQYRTWADIHVGRYQPNLDEAHSNSVHFKADGATLKRDMQVSKINHLAPALLQVLPNCHVLLILSVLHLSKT